MSKLIGSLKIREYLGISESTFIQKVTNEGLPAKKVKGEFVTTTAKLEKWIGVREKADADPDEAAKAKAAKEQADADNAQTKADKEKAEAKAAKKAAGK
jgi:hypothetical protein